MTPEDFKRAEELLADPDYEDCERFASWYGRELLDIARSHAELLEALEAIKDLAAPGQELGISDAIDLICDTYNAARAAIAKATTPTSGEAQ